MATALNGMAVLYSDLKKYEQQEPLLLRARAIWEKAYGPHHPNVAQALGNLAALYRIQGRYDAAEPLELRALAIREAALGPDHPDVARSLVGIATLYREQRQYAQAEQFELRALEVRQKSLGMEHLRVAQSLNRLAELHHLQTQYAQALPLARRASAIYRKRIAAGGADDAAVREASMNRRGFLRHLSLLSDISAAATTEAVDTLADEAFQIAQLEQTSGTASAIAKMAARFASGDDALANLVKAKQDAAEHIARAEGLLLNAASKSPELRKPSAEQGLRDDIIRLGQTMAGIDDELTQRFPEYQQLIRPDPLDLSRTQALLRPGEAMLVYVLDHEQRAFMWVIRPDIGKFLARPLDGKALAAKVAAVRSAMEFDSAGHPAPVDLSILHGLYRSLFEPVLPHLAGVDHVMVIAAGALQSLPLGMLVASPPPQITSDADYRQVDWLASHYAFSVLPSVSSIQALRQFARKPGEQKPFAGIGDPLIGNAREGAEGSSDKIARGKRTRVDVAAVFRNLVLSTKINPNAAVIVPAGENVEIADVEAIRGAPRLAETADELRAMAKATAKCHRVHHQTA